MTVKRTGSRKSQKAKASKATAKKNNTELYESVPFEVNYARGEFYIHVDESVKAASFDIFVDGEMLDKVTLSSGQFYQVTSLTTVPEYRITKLDSKRVKLPLKVDPKKANPARLRVLKTFNAETSKSFYLGGVLYQAKSGEVLKTEVQDAKGQVLGIRVDTREKITKGTRPTKDFLLVVNNFKNDFGAVCCAECRLNQLNASKAEGAKEPCGTCGQNKKK